jgi:hypothetical protein
MGRDDNWEIELVTSTSLREKAIFCGNNLDITMGSRCTVATIVCFVL